MGAFRYVANLALGLAAAGSFYAGWTQPTRLNQEQQLWQAQKKAHAAAFENRKTEFAAAQAAYDTALITKTKAEEALKTEPQDVLASKLGQAVALLKESQAALDWSSGDAGIARLYERPLNPTGAEMYDQQNLEGLGMYCTLTRNPTAGASDGTFTISRGKPTFFPLPGAAKQRIVKAQETVDSVLPDLKGIVEQKPLTVQKKELDALTRETVANLHYHVAELLASLPDTNGEQKVGETKIDVQTYAAHRTRLMALSLDLDKLVNEYRGDVVALQNALQNATKEYASKPDALCVIQEAISKAPKPGLADKLTEASTSLRIAHGNLDYKDADAGSETLFTYELKSKVPLLQKVLNNTAVNVTIITNETNGVVDGSITVTNGGKPVFFPCPGAAKRTLAQAQLQVDELFPQYKTFVAQKPLSIERPKDLDARKKEAVGDLHYRIAMLTKALPDTNGTQKIGDVNISGETYHPHRTEIEALATSLEGLAKAQTTAIDGLKLKLQEAMQAVFAADQTKGTIKSAMDGTEKLVKDDETRVPMPKLVWDLVDSKTQKNIGWALAGAAGLLMIYNFARLKYPLDERD